MIFTKDATFALGVCYYEGEGVEQDYHAASGLFKLAADKGHSGAQLALGACFHHGHGVQQNKVSLRQAKKREKKK